MEIKVLGAHNIESSSSRLTCLLIDDVLAIDSGALTSSLSFSEQERLKAILLTHSHYDHIRDVAAIAINISYFRKNVKVYSLENTLNDVLAHILNGVIYPDFTRLPQSNPPLTFSPLKAEQVEKIEGYDVLPVPVNHAGSAVGYQITSGDGKSVFYTGDTGPGLESCWEHISPQILFIDVTMPNRLEEHAISSNHLTPHLLEEELLSFGKLKGFLPVVVPIHVSAVFEDEIAAELKPVAERLGIKIEIAREGMKL